MKKTIFFTLAALLTFACKKDDSTPKDTTKPVITVTEPGAKETLKQGGEIHFEGKITDETALSEIRIDIHWANDGHDHRSANKYKKWDFEKKWPISGTTHSFHEEFPIPADADTGEYHFLVYGLDAAGNSADLVKIDFLLKEK